MIGAFMLLVFVLQWTFDGWIGAALLAIAILAMTLPYIVDEPDRLVRQDAVLAVIQASVLIAMIVYSAVFRGSAHPSAGVVWPIYILNAMVCSAISLGLYCAYRSVVGGSQLIYVFPFYGLLMHRTWLVCQMSLLNTWL